MVGSFSSLYASLPARNFHHALPPMINCYCFILDEMYAKCLKLAENNLKNQERIAELKNHKLDV